LEIMNRSWIARLFSIMFLILLGAPFLAQSSAEPTTEIYDLNVGIDEIGQVRLHVNPSTGCSWWVESAPPSSVVDISVSSDIDPTIDCGNPPRPGCSNQIVVYSFKSSTPGDYTIELRNGHAWAHSEYYAVAIVHLTVVGPPQPSDTVPEFRHETFLVFSIIVITFAVIYLKTRRGEFEKPSAVNMPRRSCEHR